MALASKGLFRLHSSIQTSLNGLQCVDLVERLASGQLYIDKHTLMTSPTLEGQKASAAALHELDLHLSVINTDNVVKIKRHFLREERLHVLHEYCGRGDLLEIVQQEVRLQIAGVSPQGFALTTLTDPGRRRIFASVLRGVQALHSVGIAHMDLSLENIFVTNSGIVKVGDLGLAQRFQPNEPKVRVLQVAKEAYAAPELLSHNESEDARCADAWSLGVILWTLCTKRALVHRASLDSDQLFCRMVEYGTATALQESGYLLHIPAPCIDLLAGLLDVNPKTRISVATALQHPWLTQETAVPKQLSRRKSIGIIKKKGEVLMKKHQRQSEKTKLVRTGCTEIALDTTRIALKSRDLAANMI